MTGKVNFGGVFEEKLLMDYLVVGWFPSADFRVRHWLVLSRVCILLKVDMFVVWFYGAL